MGDRREGVHNVVALEDVPLKLSAEASAAARPVASHAAEAPAQSSPHDEPAAAKAPADPILLTEIIGEIQHNKNMYVPTVAPTSAPTQPFPSFAKFVADPSVYPPRPGWIWRSGMTCYGGHEGPCEIEACAADVLAKCKRPPTKTPRSGWDVEMCALIPLAGEQKVELMMTMLRDVLPILEKYSGKEKYLLFGGTLIGAVRKKRLLPWTSDHDIVITDTLRKALKTNHALREELYNAGFITFASRICFHPGHKAIDAYGSCAESGTKCAAVYYYTKSVYMDMYGWSYDGEQCGLTRNDFFPARRCWIKHRDMEVQTWCPDKSEFLLCNLWGLDWRKPIQKGSIEYRGCPGYTYDRKPTEEERWRQKQLRQACIVQEKGN
jgi:hypothetical protein